MEWIDDIFKKHGSDKDMAHHGYAEHYEFLFDCWRDRPITLLEIGVQYGCSIKAWLEYFTVAKVIGVDHQELWTSPDPRYRFFKGDHGDPRFMDEVARTVGSVEIVIDDGSHIPVDQTVSFDCLWPIVTRGGLYIIEDTHPNHDPKHDPMYHRGSRELLWHIAGAINWFGKRYYGKPFPDEEPGPYELGFESCTITRGLLVIRKSAQ